MHQRNFPGRRYQRQQAAALRAQGKPARADDIQVPAALRAKRTKKHGGKLERQAAWRRRAT